MQSQVAIQNQQQQQLLQQHLTPLQLQTVKMLEMPLAQLEDKIRQELASNPSLEADRTDSDDYRDTCSDTTPADDYAAAETDGYGESEADSIDAYAPDAADNAAAPTEYPDTYDDSSDALLSDDYIPRQSVGTPTDDSQHTVERGNVKSFADTLLEQMGELDLTDIQRHIMEYLIGSLDDDGLLRKDTPAIADELAIYDSLYVENDEIETVINMLQEFTPAGIGARNLKECLTIQIGRMRATPTTMLMYDVITKCYNDFIQNRWQNICSALGISSDRAQEIKQEIRRRLNPKPGAAMGETEGHAMNQVTPDIIVSIGDGQQITFEVNHGTMPELHVSPDDERLIQDMQQNNTRSSREALAFTQQYVDRARIFIEAIRKREETMVRTMTAIIHRQRKFFLTGDDSDLKPMKLKDIADDTGYDISTMSRFSRSKYIATEWGIFPVRHLFSEGYDTGQGDIVSTKAIKLTLSDIIAHEDKQKPLSDDKLVALMKERGYPIARRTIAKYREQMGIPIARLRK